MNRDFVDIDFTVSARNGSKFVSIYSNRAVNQDFVVFYGHCAQWFEILLIFTVIAHSGPGFCRYLWQVRAVDRNCVAIYGKRTVD